MKKRTKVSDLSFTELEIKVLEDTLVRLLQETEYDYIGEYETILRKRDKPALSRAWYKIAKTLGKAV